MIPEETLLSISEASDFLGVSEPALRQWTDAHKIKAFVTPGGHSQLMRQREGFNKRVIEAVSLVDRAMDVALVALVDAHQRHQGTIRGEIFK